jgi:cytochrome o ubiquinol oxidase subunit IV|tara:strand:+ start:4716 stop:5048 length:333 start_codon:yes stop_codon:yes gene_type:complete
MSGHHAKDYGTYHKTFKVYTLGFILCVILTLIPFYAVISQTLPRSYILGILLISAIAQFLVQVICFLRLHGKTEQGIININTLVFTGVVLVVIIGGSLWIMHNLNYFMMH